MAKTKEDSMPSNEISLVYMELIDRDKNKESPKRQKKALPVCFTTTKVCTSKASSFEIVIVCSI